VGPVYPRGSTRAGRLRQVPVQLRGGQTTRPGSDPGLAVVAEPPATWQVAVLYARRWRRVKWFGWCARGGVCFTELSLSSRGRSAPRVSWARRCSRAFTSTSTALAYSTAGAAKSKAGSSRCSRKSHGRASGHARYCRNEQHDGNRIAATRSRSTHRLHAPGRRLPVMSFSTVYRLPSTVFSRRDQITQSLIRLH